MAIFTNTAEGGSNGTSVSYANSGGASGNAFNILGTAPTFATSAAERGSLGYLFNSTNQSGLTWTLTAYNAVAINFWIRFLEAPSADARIVDFRDTVPSTVGGLLLNTNLTIRLMQLTNGIGSTASPTLSTNTWYQIDMWVNNITGGSYAFTIKNVVGTVIHSSTGAFSGTATAINLVRFGKPTVYTLNGLHMDDIRAKENQASYISEEWSEPPPPTTGVFVWNGSSEVEATSVKVWNGSSEVASISTSVT